MHHHQVIADISKERQRQLDKWGQDAYHYPGKPWGIILGEEFGEVCEANLGYGVDKMPNKDSDLYAELIQVAMVAAFWAEEIIRLGDVWHKR